jgi:hypothetical protein
VLVAKGRSQIKAITPLACPEEAAAITAAIAQFARETASAGGIDGQFVQPDPWALAAMLEGVRGEIAPDLANPWINT